MKLFASMREDAQQGWVWSQDSNLPARSIVKITNPSNGKAVYCEALQIDQNFLTSYNQPPRLTISASQDVLVIGGWYRAALGGLSTQADIQLSIKPCNSWWGKFMACTHHPQTVVRVAVWLGLISVILGLLGTVLGAASVWAAEPKIAMEMGEQEKITLDFLHKMAKEFQTLIVGVIGFSGVIYTLHVNSQLSREQHERNITHEREIMRTALRAELKLIRNAFEDNSKESQENGEESDAFFPEKTYLDAYHEFIGKLGLLSLEQASAVIQAYTLAEEAPNRLRLLSAEHDQSFDKPGYIFIKAAHSKTAIGIYKAFLPAIEDALRKLESK